MWNLFYAGEQMPWINTSSSSVSMTSLENKSVTTQVKINADNLYSDMRLSLSGDNAAFFSIDKTVIDRKAGETTVTITYHPTEAGNHTATLNVQSQDINTRTITINGTSKVTGLDEISVSSAARIIYSDNEVKVLGAEVIEISIYSTLGSLTASKKADSISTSLLLPGVYLVKATTVSGEVVTGKIAVK